MENSQSNRQGQLMLKLFPAALLIIVAGISPAAAEQVCFGADETRVLVERHQLISLHDVVRSARTGGSSELISARLCETNGQLVYMIAMLGRDGRLVRMSVDARTGSVIHHR
jgi:uncharacterized membrane protein YkoI